MRALLNLKSANLHRSGGRVSFGPVGSPLAQADPIALRQPVERAAVNAEELRRELLVPARLAQYPAHVTRHDAAQAQRGSGRIGCGPRLDAPRRKILRLDDRMCCQGDGALDGVLELADVP